MELRQVEHVIGVVEHGGFTRAAAALHISQPALSQSVRTLERELGSDLFVRAGRSVTLTAAGEAFLAPARRGLRDLHTAATAVREVSGLRAGHLDLVCLPTLAVAPIAELIGRFRRAYPGVTVRLAEPEDPVAVGSRVADGTAEIGCTDAVGEVNALDGLRGGLGGGLGGGDGLVQVELARQHYRAILPPGSVVPASGIIGIAKLAQLPLIATPVGTSTRRLLDEALVGAGVTAQFAVETEHREVITDLVMAGAGAAVLPGPLAETAGARGAVVCSIRPAIVRRVVLLHRRQAISPAAMAFLKLATG